MRNKKAITLLQSLNNILMKENTSSKEATYNNYKRQVIRQN